MENPYDGPAIRGQEEKTENRVNTINTSVCLMILFLLKIDWDN